jgi:hypothetical protein
VNRLAIHLTTRALIKNVAILIAAVIQFTLVGSSASAAAPLALGGSVVRPTVSAFGSPYTAGPVPANFSNLIVSTGFPYLFTATQNGAFSGTVTSTVLQDPTTKNLAFSYSFNNQKTSLYGGTAGTDIVRVTLDDPRHPWAGIGITDSGADANGSSTAQGSISWGDGDPFALDRDATFANPDIQFRVLGLGTALLSATSDRSGTIWFATDAKNATITNVGFLDGGNTGSARGYAPAPGSVLITPITPEPASWVLLLIGCAGGGLFKFRRRLRGS